MYPWFWLWAPQVHFPWSGDVAQRIEPITHLFFQGIKPDAGNARIEEKAFSVATYGKQLGLITEILIELAEQGDVKSAQADVSLAKLKSIAAEIEKVKNAEYVLAASDIEAEVRALQRKGGPAYAQLRERLLPLLSGPE